MLLEIGKISLEIFLITWLIYGILIFIRGTRANSILIGLFLLAVISTLISRILDLTIMSYLIGKIWTFIPILIAIVFQAEIRRALTILGTQQFKRRKLSNDDHLKIIINACFFLAHSKTGALLAIEKNIGMSAVKEASVDLHSDISLEILTTIFFKNSPLHDGGVLIKNDKITNAGCVFPLTDKINLPKSLGLRHRAALGISEETDCICIVVSEETGFVSVAISGELTKNVNEAQLLYNLKKHLLKEKVSSRSVFKNLSKHIFHSKIKEKN